MAIDFGQIGNALGGVGASLQGRGLEFAKQQEDQRRQGVQDAQSTELFGLKKQQINDERTVARQTTLFTDAQAGLTLFERDDIPAVLKLAENRLANSQNFPGVNFDITQQVADLARLAVGGDKEAKERLGATLKNGVDVGVAFKILDEPEVKERKFLKIEGDKALFQEVDGTIVAESVSGLTPAQTREQVMLTIAKTKNDIKRLDSRADVNTGLRDEGVKLAKNFTDRRAFAGTINNVLKGKGGVSDLALGTAFFKIIDPGSTVTQNEFNQIKESRNLGAKGEGILQKILDGEVLNDTERRAIANLAQNQLNSFKKIARDGLGRLINVANNDKRFKGKFTAEEIYGDSIANVLAGGDIDPEKLGIAAPTGQPAAGTIVPGPQPTGATATITSQAQFDALPSGAMFIEDGVEYRKP